MKLKAGLTTSSKRKSISMTCRCLVCGNTDFLPLFRQLVRCSSCGFITADLDLPEGEVRALYHDHYFFGGEYSNYLTDEKALRRNFALRLRRLGKYLDPSRHNDLLEIGCAYGFFLDEARSRFRHVEGIDIAEGGIRHGRERFGLDVSHADFPEHDFGSRTFDVVCMWDTIEHLEHPDAYIEKIGTLTARGSLFAATTGDTGSINARLRGENWRLIHPPTHLHYFTKETMTRLLANHGFKVIYCGSCGFYRSIDNAAYNILVLREKGPRIYSYLKKTGLLDLVFYLNLYDIMYVIARKA